MIVTSLKKNTTNTDDFRGTLKKSSSQNGSCAAKNGT